ncbi:hypothetical protein RZS08_08745, partial [Arthrospira platensis SPKY1]|nr:hypothetical protein [Arthrospira platensis SPKY1]
LLTLKKRVLLIGEEKAAIEIFNIQKASELLFPDNGEMMQNFIKNVRLNKKLRSRKMKPSNQYLKIVEWSEEDQCYIGQCLDIIGPCCHGDDEVQVYNELCKIVDEWISLMIADGKSLPAPTESRHIARQLVEKAA